MFLTVMFMEPFWNHLLSLRNRKPDRPNSKLFAAHSRTERRRVGPSGVVRKRPPPYTLTGEAARIIPSSLSSNSNPAVRGLWLRVYQR